MNNMLKYTKLLLLFVFVLGLTSCDSEEETEYNLPGEWYTSLSSTYKCNFLGADNKQ